MNIIIRKFEDKDALNFFEAVVESIEHLSQWFPWCQETYSIQEAEFWVKSSQKVWQEDLEYRFVIENIDTNEIIGSVGINQINRAHKTGNLGYWIRKSYLNKGVCSKAAKQAIEYAFKSLSLHRIEINILTENYASLRVAEKLGSIYEGEHRNKLFFKNKPCNAKCYSVISNDFKI